MNVNSFKAFGVVVISVDLIALSTRLFEIYGIGDSSTLRPMKMWVSFLAVFIVGLGLVGLRKWAAIYFSAPLLWIGFSFFCSSIEQIPFPENLLGMLYGMSLMLPAVVTVRLWPHLSWRGKGFF